MFRRSSRLTVEALRFNRRALPHTHPLAVQGGDPLLLEQRQVPMRAHRLSQPVRDDTTGLGAPPGTRSSW
ncbi:MAG: hypothetical protein H0W56_00080 [Acidothermales bacterium]|nr:hypothetical protein [Acidothermales bacterium]